MVAPVSDARSSSPANKAVTSRVPPHNLDAEVSLLGAMLLSKDAIGAAAERGLTPGDFYKIGRAHV